MLFLDANAFYYYYGSEKLGQKCPPNIDVEKLQQYCGKAINKALPSSAFIEIISHFKNELDILVDVLTFFFNNNFKVYNNTITYKITSEDLLYLQRMVFNDQKTLQNEIELTKYVNSIITLKKETELSFSYFFLSEILLLYSNWKTKEKKDIPEQDINYVINFINDKIIKDNGSYTNELWHAYDKGYKCNDPQRVVKKSFVDCIYNACIKIDILIDWIAESYRQDSSVDIDDVFQYSYLKATKLKGNNPEMSKIMNVIRKSESECKSVINQLSNVYGDQFTRAQKDYSSKVLLHQWLINGQKFQKNDIFDFFWLSCLDYISKLPEYTICLTFDSKMRGFIKTEKPYISDIINSFVS